MATATLLDNTMVIYGSPMGNSNVHNHKRCPLFARRACGRQAQGRCHRASFHSTLNALKGILVYERLVGATPDLCEARRAGEEYLLARRLTRRLSTGEPVGSWLTRFAYPFRWRYDALKAVDHFREAALLDGIAPDPRIRSAIELVRAARQDDGTWLQAARDPGRVWFEVDVAEGQPSKWLTFYGTRALDWWDSQATAGAA